MPEDTSADTQQATLQAPVTPAGPTVVAISAPSDKQYPNRWKPGQSGNPVGRPKNADTLTVQLREAVAELDDKEGKTGARLMAEAMLKLAIKGNVQAAQLIYDRLEGKPAQAIMLKGDDAAALHVLHTDRLEGWDAPSALQEPASDLEQGAGYPTLPAPGLKAPERA